MLTLKAGVKPIGVQHSLLIAIETIHRTYLHYGYPCVITSLFEGKHSARSLHNRDGICRAADFRTFHLPATLRRVILEDFTAALRRLSPRYQAIFEPSPEHFHVEYDPAIAES